MIKKILSLVLIAIFLFSGAGCTGEWRRKFVRKKKHEKKKVPIFNFFYHEYSTLTQL